MNYKGSYPAATTGNIVILVYYRWYFVGRVAQSV